MTLQAIRSQFKALESQNWPLGHKKRPTSLQIRFDEQERPVAADIRGRRGKIWAWPDKFDSKLEINENTAQDHRIFNLQSHKVEENFWDLRTWGQNTL